MNEETRIEAIPSALRQSGLAEHDFSGESVRLAELTGLSLARLRHHPRSGDAPSGLPEEAGQCNDTDPAVLCLRPGEWLWISESDAPEALLEQAAGRAGGHGGAAYDVSDGMAAFRLSGSGAAWLLSKLSGLDFQGEAGGEAHCARTRMGRISVLVHHHRPETGSYVFDLFVDRGCARYLWELLKASAPHADDLVRAFGGSA